MNVTPRDIIAFWRDEAGPERWFEADAAFDAEIVARFRSIWERARDGKLDDWQGSVEGALALILVLDQFPRNMFRGRAEAFSTDARARKVAERALVGGYDLMITPSGLRAFFYLPLMHSEDLADQDRSVAFIAERLGTASRNYPFALAHREEIRRFGRFPHRNSALGRNSTDAELRFLEASRPR
jgi:uncharacterized protein (DUF924 family)